MTLYWQRRDLTADNGAGADVGPPGPLPRELVGRAADALADLSWTPEAWGLRGFGFRIVTRPAPVPAEIARLWARLALQGAGLLETVEAAIAQADLLTQIYWADAASFRRDSPILAGFSAGIGLTDADLDALFRSAGALARAAAAELV